MDFGVKKLNNLYYYYCAYADYIIRFVRDVWFHYVVSVAHVDPGARFVAPEVAWSVVLEDGHGRKRMVADVLESSSDLAGEMRQFNLGRR